jgi:hypothetical protein
MPSNLVKLNVDQFANLLDLSRDEARALIQRKADDGQWRLNADGEGDAFVELPSSDLYIEIEAKGEARREDPVRDDQESILHQRPNPKVKALRQENKDLRSVLGKSADLIQELKSGLHKEPKPPEPTAGQDSSLTEALAATKAELVRAYDRIIDLQQQLVDAKQSTASSREDSEIVQELASLLNRLNSRSE